MTVITAADVALMKRALALLPRQKRFDDIAFNVRPISEKWQWVGRNSAYRTAVANVAYIWRRSDAEDKFGQMPAAFERRRCELHSSGLILPASAPVWAAADFKIWEEADAVTDATGDAAAVRAWHVVMQIPETIDIRHWACLVEGFVERELTAKGAATAWAIHSLEGEDGWIVSPHAHLVVTARRWRHDGRHGQRHTAWVGSWAAHRRLELAWRRRCKAGFVF